MKYYLIYTCHDTFFKVFNSYITLLSYLKDLTLEYGDDSDFRYHIVYGEELSVC